MIFHSDLRFAFLGTTGIPAVITIDRLACTDWYAHGSSLAYRLHGLPHVSDLSQHIHKTLLRRSYRQRNQSFREKDKLDDRMLSDA
jgi:hypothetical protein